MKIYTPSEENYKLNKIVTASKIYNKSHLLQIQKVQYQPKVSKNFKDSYPQYTLPLLQILSSDPQDHESANKFITGTNAILFYIAGKENFSDKLEKSRIINQLQKLQTDVDPATGIMILQSKNYQQLQSQQIAKSRQILLKYMKQLNQKLALRTFVVSDRITIADVSIFHNLFAVLQFFKEEAAKLKNLSRWMSFMENLNLGKV